MRFDKKDKMFYDIAMEIRHVVHTFPPVINTNCRALILGSVPSVKSMAYGFYYMHPQNRFWQVLGALLQENLYGTVKDKKIEILLSRGIALYDSVYECDITGSSDTKIIHAVAADIPALIRDTNIQRIFCNGTASYAYLMNAHSALASITVQLPSTSPANASYTLERLIYAYSAITDFLNN